MNAVHTIVTTTITTLIGFIVAMIPYGFGIWLGILPDNAFLALGFFVCVGMIIAFFNQEAIGQQLRKWTASHE